MAGPAKDAQHVPKPDDFLHGGPGVEGHLGGWKVQEGLPAWVLGQQQPAEQHSAPAPQDSAAVV